MRARARARVGARVGAAILVLGGVCALRAWAPLGPAGADRDARAANAANGDLEPGELEDVDADRPTGPGEDGDADRPTGAGEANRQRFLQRADEKGEIPMDRLLEAKTQIDAMRMRHQDAGLWDWYWLGPGNIGGRIRAVLPHPTVAGRIFVGSRSGGIWRTDDGGGSGSAGDDCTANPAGTPLGLV